MYPRNAASPERIAIGPVVQISDGAVQTSGVSIKVKPQGGSASAGGGTTSYEEGIVEYLPTQAETDHTSFEVIAYKTGCIPVAATIVTTAAATPGTVLLAPVTHTSAVVPTVSTLTGHTPQTGDAFARLGAPAGASVSADVAAVKTQTAAIETDTQDIQSRIPAALVSGRIDASVGAVAADAITAAALAADAGTEIGTAVWASTTRVLTAGTNIALAKGTGVTGFNDLSAAQVNAEVDTAISDAALATAANLATVASYLDTEIAAILADTNELQADWADGGRLDLILDARASQASVDTIDGIVDSILVDTAEVGSAGAGLTALATAAALATVDGNVDAILADTNELQGDWANGGRLDLLLDGAASAGDPWTTALPGAYGAGTAGQIIGDYIDAAISSISAGSGLDAAGVRAALGMASADLDDQLDAISTAVADVPTNSELTTALAAADDAVLAAVADLPTNAELATALAAADDAVLAAIADVPTNAELATALAAADDAVLAAVAALSIPTATQNADALLNRDMSAVSDTNARSPLNALRHIRNKWDTSTNAGHVTVFKEDDTTEAWRAALATDGAAEPITGSDPT